MYIKKIIDVDEFIHFENTLDGYKQFEVEIPHSELKEAIVAVTEQDVNWASTQHGIGGGYASQYVECSVYPIGASDEDIERFSEDYECRLLLYGVDSNGPTLKFTLFVLLKGDTYVSHFSWEHARAYRDCLGGGYGIEEYGTAKSYYTTITISGVNSMDEIIEQVHGSGFSGTISSHKAISDDITFSDIVVAANSFSATQELLGRLQAIVDLSPYTLTRSTVEEE